MRHLLLGLLCLLIPTTLLAHNIPISTSGFKVGFLHPWTGLDHTLAMLSVGILAGQWSQGWQWKLPLLFVVGLILGGLIGYNDVAISWANGGITLSVVVLGALIALPKQISSMILIMIVGIFAVCHGHSHGHAVAHVNHPALYASGFIMASICLHVLGLGLSLFFTQYLNQIWMRVSGVGIALLGLWIVT